MTVKKALRRALCWVGLALLFNLGVLLFQGRQSAIEFFGGYLIELSLSVDNLFLFLMIFSSFGIPAEYQRRVLAFGVAGAILMRFLFILLGAALVRRFEWALYVFGAILIFSGTRMMMASDHQKDYKGHSLMMRFGKVFPFTGKLEGEKFFVRRNGRVYATLLFTVLLLVEFSDLLFAIDSIPAIFSITTDVFIVYTSNIFAILGLRSFYFALERLCRIFAYMKYGVAAVLVFTGVKLSMLFFHFEIPIPLSIGIIAAALSVSIVASLLFASPGERP